MQTTDQQLPKMFSCCYCCYCFQDVCGNILIFWVIVMNQMYKGCLRARANTTRELFIWTFNKKHISKGARITSGYNLRLLYSQAVFLLNLCVNYYYFFSLQLIAHTLTTKWALSSCSYYPEYSQYYCENKTLRMEPTARITLGLFHRRRIRSLHSQCMEKSFCTQMGLISSSCRGAV